jgi:succinoglycan biosynthesis transport protein ExoP
MNTSHLIGAPESAMGSPMGLGPTQEEQAAGGGISLLQITSILRCYWKHTLISVVALIGLSFVVIKLLPKSYLATATLMFHYENKDVLAGREFPAAGGNGSYMTTQIELIMSRVVLQPVVDRLKLTTDKAFAGGYVGTPAAVNEVATNALHDILQVQPGTGGQLVYISVPSKTPERAAELANAVADEYLTQERERTNEPAVERAQRYANQLGELRERVIQSQDRVTEFRQQHNLTQIVASEVGDTESADLHALQDKLESAQNQRRELESRQLGADASPDAVLSSGNIPGLRSKLGNEEGEMAQLRATLGPKHPKVLELQSEMDSTRHALAGEIQSLGANNSVQLAQAKQLEGKYQAALDAERSRLLDRRGLQDEGAKLLLELQSAQANYKRALDGYDEIMFATAGNYKDVTLISRADPPAKPAKPAKMKYFMVACAGSLGLSFIWPFGYELFLNRRLRCRDDLERNFGVPVLVELQRVPALQGG